VVIYGWIARSDGKRDFAVGESNKATGEAEWWATSSAKYSERLHVALGGDLKEHIACLPFKEVLAACGLYPIEART
jgi:hypothetical protein